MKKIGVSVVVAATLCIVCVLVTYSSGQAISLTISARASSWSIGHPIPIQVRLTNTSPLEIKVRRALATGDAEFTYTIVMLDNQGRAVPRTHYGQEAQDRHLIVTRTISRLAPDAALTETMDLTKLFKLTEADTYTVRVARRWPVDTKKTIWSNTLTLTVTK